MPHPALDTLRENRVLLVAHRGNSVAAPENTLAAFRSALEVGVDFVELDYHHSADGVPVVIHDAELDHRTDAVALWGGEHLRVDARPLAELRELDAGGWFGPTFAGTRISTLEEALEVIEPRGMTMVERKAGDAATLVALLDRRGWRDRVVVQAFDWDFLLDCHKLSPELVTGALGEKTLDRPRVLRIVELGCSIVGWKQQDLDAAAIRLAHEHGLKVWSWTIDDVARARELLSAGLDGVITNNPAVMKAVIAGR